MDSDIYLKFLAALLFVLALIGFLTILVRRFGFGLPTASFLKGEAKRLSVVEMSIVDAKRRLVLLRRDDTEHLVLLGPDGDIVIETSIPSTGSEKTEKNAKKNASAIKAASQKSQGEE